MPVHTAVTFADPEFFTLEGPRPTYRDTAQCPDQTPCASFRPFPDGRYRLIAEGNLVSCPETSFEVPITHPVVITCTRMAPPDP